MDRHRRQPGSEDYTDVLPDHILLTLYNDGPASAVLVAARITFQSRYILCQCIPSMLGPANKWNEMKWTFNFSNVWYFFPSTNSVMNCKKRLLENYCVLYGVWQFNRVFSNLLYLTLLLKHYWIQDPNSRRVGIMITFDFLHARGVYPDERYPS